jgi:Bacterial regulatory proteins, luxR family
VRTVETHLTHIYRKFGLRSRTELAARTGAKAKCAGAKVLWFPAPQDAVRPAAGFRDFRQGASWEHARDWLTRLIDPGERQDR